MKALKEICNEYERKLLTKIVDPGKLVVSGVGWFKLLC
jgi:hypothetical protein